VPRQADRIRRSPRSRTRRGPPSRWRPPWSARSPGCGPPGALSL